MTRMHTHSDTAPNVFRVDQSDPMMPAFFRRFAFVALLAPALASAHAGDGHIHVGMLQGLLHPLTGLDHLLAMLAVGWWAAATQAKRWWVVPLVFALATFAGALVGAVTSSAMPGVEWLIGASVIAFGLLMLATRRLPVTAAMVLAAGSGIAHGVAHGAELSGDAAVGLWIVGMAVATLGLHATGAIAGRLALRHGLWATRAAGAVTALLGVAIVGGVL